MTIDRNRSDVITNLFNYALSHSIAVVFESLSPDTPPAVNVHERKIMMNNCWRNPNEIPFQFAHEISHIILKQQTENILYFTPSKYGIEFEANKHAIRMLLSFYKEDREFIKLNYHNFMEYFSIPYHLEDAVINEVSKL